MQPRNACPAAQIAVGWEPREGLGTGERHKDIQAWPPSVSCNLFMGRSCFSFSPLNAVKPAEHETGRNIQELEVNLMAQGLVAQLSLYLSFFFYMCAHACVCHVYMYVDVYASVYE